MSGNRTSFRPGPESPNWKGGSTKHPLYKVWQQMIRRCTVPTHQSWHNYGARGITVCDRWRNDFWAFIADMGPRPPGLSIDRIDNDGGYEPGNCRWATRLQQNANRRPSPRRLTCKEGHPYTEGSYTLVRRSDGGNPKRVCRQCRSEKRRALRNAARNAA